MPTHRCQPANHHDSKFSVLLIVVRALRTATAGRGEGMTKGHVGQATRLLRPPTPSPEPGSTSLGSASNSESESGGFVDLLRGLAQPDVVPEAPPNHRQLPPVPAADGGARVIGAARQVGGGCQR